MTNLIALGILCLAASVQGFSKYGRTCRDIGCLGSEVCILAEDPCSIGHATDCGTYPTCKKKSLVDGGGTNAEPARPVAPAPRPVYPSPPRDDESPNYPPPPPPRSNYPSVPSYGSNSGGGYGGNNGGYGGNTGGYGGSSGGYGSNTGGYGGNTGYPGNNGGYQQHGGYNPSYSQPGSQQTGYVAKNYGQSHASRSGATTRKPASYGWNLG